MTDRLDDRDQGHRRSTPTSTGSTSTTRPTAAGRPLVLLHGGLGSGEMFGPVAAGARRAATR